LYTDDGIRVVLADFEAGTTTRLAAIEWPARFDASGAIIYAPAWVYGPSNDDPDSADGVTTTVLEGTALEAIIEVAGAPSANLIWFDRPAVVMTDAGPVLAVEFATGCHGGTTVYGPDNRDGRCFTAAAGAAVSPDGVHVALAKHTPRVTGPPLSVPYDIVLVEVATGEVRTLAREAWSFSEPFLEWNASGTHILVTWPFAFGI